MIPTLETPRLRLVPPSLSILAAEQAFWSSDRSRHMGGKTPAHRIWRSIALHLGHWELRGYGEWSVVEAATGQPVGMCGIWHPEPWPEPELAYHLYEGFEGRGYITEAGNTVLDFAARRLGLDSLGGMIEPANLPSQRVSARLGGAKSGDTFAPEPGEHVEIWRYDLRARRA